MQGDIWQLFKTNQIPNTTEGLQLVLENILPENCFCLAKVVANNLLSLTNGRM